MSTEIGYSTKNLEQSIQRTETTKNNQDNTIGSSSVCPHKQNKIWHMQWPMNKNLELPIRTKRAGNKLAKEKKHDAKIAQCRSI